MTNLYGAMSGALAVVLCQTSINGFIGSVPCGRHVSPAD